MIKLKVKVKDTNNIPDLLIRLKEARSKKGKVGYPAGSKQEMIAAVHEYGARIKVTDKMRGYLAAHGLHLRASTSHIVIPERSFLRTGADLAQREIDAQAKLLIKHLFDGSLTAEGFLEELALILKGKIQEYAIDLNNPKNHPFTVEMKGSENPLVASGELIEKMEVEVE